MIDKNFTKSVYLSWYTLTIIIEKVIIGKYSGMRNWQEIRLTNRFSIPEKREQHRDTSGYKPSDLSFPQNEIFNNSGLNQIFFITPLQKEIEMEFILDEK